MSTNANYALEQSIGQEHRDALALRMAVATTAIIIATGVVAYVVGYAQALKAQSNLPANGTAGSKNPAVDTYVAPPPPNGSLPTPQNSLPKPPPNPTR